jgi:hypothetical protein
MTLTLDLPPAVEAKLREEATREQQSPEEFVRTVLEERLVTSPKNELGLSAWLEARLAGPPDLEEAEGYPVWIEPFQLREGFVD